MPSQAQSRGSGTEREGGGQGGPITRRGAGPRRRGANTWGRPGGALRRREGGVATVFRHLVFEMAPGPKQNPDALSIKIWEEIPLWEKYVRRYAV